LGEGNRDGDPYLGFYGIFGRAVEPFDAQMLLDPLERSDNPDRVTILRKGHVFEGKAPIVIGSILRHFALPRHSTERQPLTHSGRMDGLE
jgi:hypothetical protein